MFWMLALYALLMVLASVVGFLFSHRLGHHPRSARLSAAASAGVLLGLCFLFLLPESFEHLLAHDDRSPVRLPSRVLELCLSFSLGFLVLLTVERYLLRIEKHATCFPGDHEHVFHASHERGGVWSAVLALGLHSFFDGVALRTVDEAPSLGLAMGLGIALHKIPESGSLLIVLRRGEVRRWLQILLLISYLCATPLGMLVSHQMHHVLSARVMGWILSFAAGALLHLVAGHLIPETTEADGKTRHVSTYGLMMAGFFVVVCARLLSPGHR